MNRFLYRLGAVIIIIAIFIFLLFQLFYNIYMPQETETAFLFTQSDYITAKGIAVREETVVSSKTNGVRCYLYGDGDKISSGMTIAEVYDSESDVNNKAEIAKLDSEIALLEKCQNPGKTGFSNADIINGQITEKLMNITGLASSGNLNGAESLKNDYVMLLNTRQIATGRAKDFNARIEVLQNRRAELVDEMGTAKGAVKAPASGYFVSKIDGLEDKLSIESVYDLSYDEIAGYIEEDPESYYSDEVVGKLITQFDWYFAVPVPAEKERSFFRGARVTISFPYASSREYDATIADILTYDEGGKIALFKLDTMNSEIAAIRSEQIEISFKRYSGLKVQKKAVRFNANNEVGVYIKVGDNIEFKKLDISFESDDFVISRQNSDNDYLQLYDEVIVEGKDLSEHST